MKVARPYPPNAESVSGCSILPLAGHPMPKTHRNLERAHARTTFLAVASSAVLSVGGGRDLPHEHLTSPARGRST
jgi:hypothetical protein